MTTTTEISKSPTHPFTYSFTTCFKVEEITKMLKDTPPKGEVLEMGCGSAYFLTVLRKEFPEANFKFTGIDLEKDAVDVAKPFLKPGDEIVHGSVEDMPFTDNKFDLILYLDVIEHVGDDKKSLSEAFRVLKPGGTLIVSTPNSSALLTDTFFCEYMHDHDHMENQRPGYTKEELSTLLENEKFKVKKTAFTNVFLSELLITITKLGYRLKKPKYSSQADVIGVSKSFLFNLHKKIFFPFGYAVGKTEEVLLGKVLNGHCLIIKAIK